MSNTLTRLKKDDKSVLSAAQATGAGSVIDVRGYKNIYFTVTCAGTLDTGTDSIVVKCQGSSAGTAPTFDSAASATNPWDYIRCSNKSNGAAIAGDTGMVFADGGTYDVATYVINVEAENLRWVTLNITTYTDADKSASITATCSASN